MASASATIGFDRETLRAIREMTDAMGRFSAAVERLERLERRRRPAPGAFTWVTPPTEPGEAPEDQGLVFQDPATDEAP